MNSAIIQELAKKHGLAILLFLAICCIYFLPALQGEKLPTHDIKMNDGMAKEVLDYREKTGEVSLWTNSMFGGMPTYQIATPYPNSIFIVKSFFNVLVRGLPKPLNMLFLCFISFYALMLSFKVKHWLAIAGALAFGFSTYNIYIIEAGHNTKALAIGLAPLVLAAVQFTFTSKRWILGAAFAGLAMAFEIKVNHIQITYYLAFILLAYGISLLILKAKSGEIKKMIPRIAVLIFAFVLAIGANAGNLMTTAEYTQESTRGRSDLTKNDENKSSGLDFEYATAWSFGIGETGTLLIPNFYGGASGENIVKDGALWESLSRKGIREAQLKDIQLPYYHGSQSLVSGPIYFGVIIAFLFVLGLIILDEKYKYWILSASILGLLFAWGHNFESIQRLFFNYLPGYNKFRTVSMAMVIPQITFPLMAILTLNKVFDGSIKKDALIKALKISGGIVGGFIVIFLLAPSAVMSFSNPMDEQMLGGFAKSVQIPMPDFLDLLAEDRISMLRADAFRSLIFTGIAIGLIYLFALDKLKQKWVVAGIALAIVVDVWGIDLRYLTHDDFVSARKYENQVVASPADKQILQDPDLSYRVLNLSVSPFNDATTSYFHKSLGGYHGAKLKRIQELISYNISSELPAIQQVRFQDPKLSPVINMFNTKYYIVPLQNGGTIAVPNEGACGNAWFVDNVVTVENADAEIDSVKNFDPKITAYVDKSFSEYLNGFNGSKVNGSIELTSYAPNKLSYKYKADKEGFAVFSEAYYRGNIDWISKIDGEPKDHIRTDYHLRGMLLPAGEHTITFEFDPPTYYKGESYSLASSIMLILLLLGGIFFAYKESKENSTEKEA